MNFVATLHFGFRCILCRTNIPSAYHAHGSDHDCNSDATKTVQDPPLLFDLHLDPSEEYTLTPDDPEYNQTMSIISKVCIVIMYN